MNNLTADEKAEMLRLREQLKALRQAANGLEHGLQKIWTRLLEIDEQVDERMFGK